MASEVISLLFL